MRRGTTPTHNFTVDVDLRDAVVYISYAQGGRVIVEKTGDDITITATKLETTLTQEETLRFVPGKDVEMQIRYRKPDGSADASEIMYIKAEALLKDGVI